VEERKRIYPSTQLISVLHPVVLKVYLYLLGWQSQKTIKIYTSQLAKVLKLKEKDVELAIQSLIDNKLINVKHNDSYEVTFNSDEVDNYFKTPLGVVSEMELLPIPKEATWNKETPKTVEKEMSKDEMLKLLLKLQMALKEKEEEKETDDIMNALPY
jgi:hypothetical protein